MNVPHILTIAGSDSGGGAGIQADLKTISMLGAYGLSVVTALTAQNTCGVTGIDAPPAQFVALQLKTVLDDITIHSAKTGMLFSASIIKAVAPFLAKKTYPLVVDPVCVSQSGHKLLEDDAVRSMADRIIPLADLLTPNIPEAELFTGMSIRSPEDACRAGEKLLELGPRAVLVKGGHLDSVTATDWLVCPGQKPLPLMQPRIDTKNNHGTGCTLSAAAATFLGQGLELTQSVRKAQQYLNLALRTSFNPGRGCGPVNHLAPLFKDRARPQVLDDLARSVARLAAMPGLAGLVPEVRMNMALALPFADCIDDVAAYSGRITCTRRGEVIPAGCPEFGASSHMAKVVLAARRVNPDISCALNIRFSDAIIEALDAIGVVAAWFDRADEPSYLKEREGSSLEWGTFDALSRHEEPTAVRAVCDRGEVGKEPIVRILAEDSDRLLRTVSSLLAALRS